MITDNNLNIAITAAITAGKEILKFYNNNKTIEFESKDDDSPVTIADLQSNDIICKALREKTKGIAIFTEEDAKNPERLDANKVWIIDPLDGTKDFIKKTGDFTVNIALVEDHVPTLGIIFIPGTLELFIAKKGSGAHYYKFEETEEAYQNNNEENIPFNKFEKLAVNKTNNISDAILVKSRSYASPKLQAVIDIIKPKESLGKGSSLKGCSVAKGDAHVYVRITPINEWDICAMNLIVNEAGGIITTLRGDKILYNRPNPLIKGIVCSNKVLHQELLMAVNEVIKD